MGKEEEIYTLSHGLNRKSCGQSQVNDVYIAATEQRTGQVKLWQHPHVHNENVQKGSSEAVYNASLDR